MIIIQCFGMGNLIRHGIDAYKQTLNLKNDVFNKPHLIKTTKSPDSKYRRVAKFLILIGSEQAAEILAELESEHVNEISKEIARIKVIRPEEKEKIFAEFQSMLSGQYRLKGSSRGGVEAARRILYAARGPEKGEELLNRAIPKTKENIFGFLEDFSPDQLIQLLQTETAQAAALILSRLPPKLSAAVIGRLPPESKPEVLKRIARQKTVSPETLEQIAAALKEKTRHTRGSANDIEIDGMRALTAILKQGDFTFCDKIIDEIEESDPNIGKFLKEKLYTLDDVINAVDRPIQEKLASMSEREIAYLLKEGNREFSEKILSCVSSGRRKLIREEFEILGDVSRRDSESAALTFLSWFRRAREDGDIVFYGDKDVFL